MAAGVATIKVLIQTSTVFTGIEIPRMTRGAGTCVLRPAIVYILVIVGVTGATSNVAIMVTRIVAIVWMVIINRRPAISRVARVAIRGGNKMIPTLTGCRITVVTRYAVTRYTLVVPGTADKSGRGMTEMAIQISRNVISRFTRSGYSMTGSTIIHDTGMIEHSTGKAARRMADTTILIGGRVVTCFTGGEYPIVAGLAVIHDTLMIKSSGEETRGHMTLTAIIVGGNMVGRFTCCIRTIVARGAIINNASVIKAGTCKGCSVVAYGTVFRCGHMIRRLASGIGTIVAGRAVIHDTGMIKHRRGKITRHVTDAAIIVSRNMVVILADGIITVMT